MSRTCGKRLFVLMAGVVVAWFSACHTAARARQESLRFARVFVSEKCVVYLQFRGFQGLDLSAAMSVEELKTAQHVKLRLGEPNDLFLSEITLPIPAGQLPFGVTSVKATLGRRLVPASSFEGSITVCRTDSQKAQWQYVSSVNFTPGDDPATAVPLRVTDLQNLKPALKTKVSKGRLSVGLQFRHADGSFLGLTDVVKNGRPAQVKLVVANNAGVKVATKAGALADFGFS